MTLKVTNYLASAQMRNVLRSHTTGAILADQIILSAEKCLGTYKSIDSVYTGAFVPGKLRLNPVTIKSGFGSCTSGHATGFYSNMDYTLDGMFGCWPYTMPYGVWNSNLANESKVRANAKLNSPELEVGVMLGELGETIQMLRHPLRGVSKELTKMYKGYSLMRKGKSAVDAAAQAWLQYRYGILPFLSDAQALQKQFHTQVGKYSTELQSKRAGTRTKSIERTVLSTNGAIAGYGWNVERTVETETLSTSVCYYQHLLELEARSTMAFWGLHPSQFASVAWELVPYSFVADWFVNFGDWIRAISPTFNLVKLGGCTSQKTNIAVHNRLLPPYYIGSSSYPLSSMQESTYTWNSSTLIRIVDTPGAGTPAFNADWYNFNRSISGAALLWQRCMRDIGRFGR